VEIQIKKLAERLYESKIELELSKGAISFLAENGYDVAFGSRPLKRAILRL